MGVFENIDRKEENLAEIVSDRENLEKVFSKEIILEGEKCTFLNILLYLAYKCNDDDNNFYQNLLKIGIENSTLEILNYVESQGNTLLHYLAIKQELKLIELLLNKGVKIVRNNKGHFPESKNKEINEKITNYLKTGRIDFYKEINNNSIVKQDILGDYKVYHFDTRLFLKSQESQLKNLTVEKFPGKLFLIVHKLEGIENNNPQVRSVSVCIKKNDYEVYTESYDIKEEEISPNETLIIPINDYNTFLEGKVYACVWEDDKIFKNVKIGFFDLFISKEDLENCHNSIYDVNSKVLFYTNFYRFMKSIFYSPRTLVKNISFKMCYIAEQEYNFVEAPQPNSTHSLYNWLLIRKISVFVWFKGYCHVKTSNDTLWKRRMVHWQGIHLLIFNEYSGKKVNDINMTAIDKNNIVLNEEAYKIKVPMRQGYKIDLCFDSKDLYKKFELGVKTFTQF